MTQITITSKGQITLPAEARRSLRLEKGDQLTISLDLATGSLILQKPQSIDELSLKISGYAKKNEPITNVDDYYQQHREQSQ